MSRHNHQVRAIVIKKRPWNEADYKVTLYTELLGKIEAFAKSARKITSHLNGHLETLNIGFFQLYETPHRITILQGNTEKNFKNIRGNFQKSVLGLAIAEILEKSTPHSGAEKLVFDLTEKTLENIDRDTASNLSIENFKVRLLHILGVLPEISNCSTCQKRWNAESKIWISHEGQIVCEVCKSQVSGSMAALEFKYLKLLNFLLHNDIEKKKIMLTPPERNRLRSITQLFLNNYLNEEILGEKILGL